MKTFICSGCNRKFGIDDLTIMGPDILDPPLRTYWCNKPSCMTKQKFFSVAVNRKLDDRARKLLWELRKRGDREGEEFVMLLYMVNKMEEMKK